MIENLINFSFPFFILLLIALIEEKSKLLYIFIFTCILTWLLTFVIYPNFFQEQYILRTALLIANPTYYGVLKSGWSKYFSGDF